MNNKDEIKFETIKERNVEVDPLSPVNLALVDKYSKEENLTLYNILNDKLKKDKNSLKKEFLASLESYSSPGKDLFTYRSIKTGLIELRLTAYNYADKLGMTPKEVIEKINSTIKKLDEHVLDARDELYNEALELLADEEGYKELERLRIEFQKAMEVQYIKSTIKSVDKLDSSKIDLIGMLKEGRDE